MFRTDAQLVRLHYWTTPVTQWAIPLHNGLFAGPVTQRASPLIPSPIPIPIPIPIPSPSPSPSLSS